MDPIRLSPELVEAAERLAALLRVSPAAVGLSDRLRADWVCDLDDPSRNLSEEAAAEIDRLQAANQHLLETNTYLLNECHRKFEEIERLRDALLMASCPSSNHGHSVGECVAAGRRACECCRGASACP